MKHTLIKMTTPQGEVVSVAETKVEKHLNRGYQHTKTKPTKTSQPEMVDSDDTHEEIDKNEEEV
tara:strand:- start:2449 stop:2640 length:192 start_codon:yes stop_codon:yes gene_type:complete